LQVGGEVSVEGLDRVVVLVLIAFESFGSLGKVTPHWSLVV